MAWLTAACSGPPGEVRQIVGTVAPAAQTSKPAATRNATSAPTKQAPAELYFANCTDARNAGAAPLHRGDPGYRPGLDRDNDGVACE